jgi:hypothetical protein
VHHVFTIGKPPPFVRPQLGALAPPSNPPLRGSCATALGANWDQLGTNTFLAMLGTNRFLAMLGTNRCFCHAGNQQGFCHAGNQQVSCQVGNQQVSCQVGKPIGFCVAAWSWPWARVDWYLRPATETRQAAQSQALIGE